MLVLANQLRRALVEMTANFVPIMYCAIALFFSSINNPIPMQVTSLRHDNDHPRAIQALIRLS